MFTLETLEIIGYENKPLSHTFLKQKTETQHVAILFPGVGYTVHMPLLYYPMRELLANGADVLQIATVYAKQADYGRLSPTDRLRWVFGDATAACRAALAQRAYGQITLVGKSLGTLAMGFLLTTEKALTHAQAVWLTPLLWNDILRSQIQQAKPRSLFVVGTADPHYNPRGLTDVTAATGGDTVVIDGADHSLELEGDVVASLKAMARVVRALQTFLGDR